MLWSEGASRPGGADAGGRPWTWRLPLGERAMSGRDISSALNCTPDGDDNCVVWQPRVFWMTGKAARIVCKKAAQQWIAALAANAASQLEQRPPSRVRKKKNNMWMTRGWSIFFFKPTTRLVRNKNARWESTQLFQKTASINIGPSLPPHGKLIISEKTKSLSSTPRTVAVI